MIVELSVENLAIIERSHIALGPGFTVLTGETGAGKSLLIDAIELSLGERADAELVRSGTTRASVSLTLDLSNDPILRERCAELSVDLEDGLLFIQREVYAEGRSQARVGGKLIPAATLRRLGELLIDLHGQHDHQSLLRVERHCGFLDSWIGSEATGLSEEVRRLYAVREEVAQKLASLRSGLRDREHRLDLLRFQVQEIENAEIQPGEMAALESAIARLKNVERLSLAMLGALDSLAGREGSATELIGAALKMLDDAARIDLTLAPIVDQIRESFYSLEEGSRQLSESVASLEADPERLEEAAARLDLIRRLARKYGETERAIVEFGEKARAELELLEESETSEGSLATALEAANFELHAAASRLTQLRTERAGTFSDLVQDQIRELAMDRAMFEVAINPKEIDSTGADAVEFYFSANSGEPPRPLAKIASGGEISRVMLGIKASLAGSAAVPTLIFDEIDAGLGGRAAAVVAQKLEQLAAYHQVIVISHLPQIASRAASHYRIEKTESGGRVITGVRLLGPEERVEEVARMLAGESISESAIANAREMIAGA